MKMLSGTTKILQVYFLDNIVVPKSIITKQSIVCQSLAVVELISLKMKMLKI